METQAHRLKYTHWIQSCPFSVGQSQVGILMLSPPLSPKLWRSYKIHIIKTCFQNTLCLLYFWNDGISTQNSKVLFLTLKEEKYKVLHGIQKNHGNLFNNYEPPVLRTFPSTLVTVTWNDGHLDESDPWLLIRLNLLFQLNLQPVQFNCEFSQSWNLEIYFSSSLVFWG